MADVLGRARLKRRRSFLLRVADEPALEVASLLRGDLTLGSETRCSLLCPVTGKALGLTGADIALLLLLPADRWVAERDLPGVSWSACLALAARGLLLSDPEADAWRGLDAAEQHLEAAGWDDVVATYHAYSRWQGVKNTVADDRSDAAHEARLERLRHRRGDPPPHFVQRADAMARTELRVPALEGEFFNALVRRRTTRAFDAHTPLPLHMLETVLFSVFAAHGLKEFAAGISAIRRTSPSGGALHPIEAYPLVRHVDGLAPGLYHYESGSHVLALLEGISCEDVGLLIDEFTAGQTYFADVHAAIVHVARFDRNMWKYRRHRKAYKAVLMDSAHLSQTLYLTAAHLGLGAFYTAAINDADAGARLRLHPQREAVVAISGIGIAGSGRDDLHFMADPYSPIRLVQEDFYGHADSRPDQAGAYAVKGSTRVS